MFICNLGLRWFIVYCGSFGFGLYVSVVVMYIYIYISVCGTDGNEKPKSDRKDVEESESGGGETQAEIVNHDSKGTLDNMFL